MAIKFYKPTTSGRRQMTTTDYSELSKVAPERSLLAPLKKNSGRNSYGRITVRHKGGAQRRKYRHRKELFIPLYGYKQVGGKVRYADTVFLPPALQKEIGAKRI